MLYVDTCLKIFLRKRFLLNKYTIHIFTEERLSPLTDLQYEVGFHSLVRTFNEKDFSSLVYFMY